MKPLSESDKRVVENLRLVADAIENGWAVEENDGVHAEWRPIDTHHDFAVCSFFAYRIACSPIDDELACKIRAWFRTFAKRLALGPQNLEPEAREICEGLGVLKGGGSCE